jgi:trans-aconitate 2-methyltransferase
MAENRSQPIWDPAVYERYKVYRDRPALDLLLQIPGDLDPDEIWDLGCGTGEHAALLAARHPGAQVHGMDTSAEMLAKAKGRPAAVEWIQGDIAAFAPAVAPDLIFTNAALQWLPDHEVLFPRLVASLAPGGVLACQIPVASDQGWRVALRESIAAGPWAAKLAGVVGVHPTPDMDDYYRWLAPISDSVDIWTTTYLHVLEGDDSVVDWVSGTALRPFAQALEGEERAAFLADYTARVAARFPKQGDGVTLMPFPRLFMIVQR